MPRSYDINLYGSYSTLLAAGSFIDKLKMSGRIELHIGFSTGAPVKSYDMAMRTHLTVCGTTLTINPTADLARGSHYYVTLVSSKPLRITRLSGNFRICRQYPLKLPGSI